MLNRSERRERCGSVELRDPRPEEYLPEIHLPAPRTSPLDSLWPNGDRKDISRSKTCRTFGANVSRVLIKSFFL